MPSLTQAASNRHIEATSTSIDGWFVWLQGMIIMIVAYFMDFFSYYYFLLLLFISVFVLISFNFFYFKTYYSVIRNILAMLLCVANYTNESCGKYVEAHIHMLTY